MSRSTSTHISEAPTRPIASALSEPGADELFRGPVGGGGAELRLDEKLRQAYLWIANHGIISPFHDIHYHKLAGPSFRFGDRKIEVELPTDQSYSSYILLPLLNLVVRRRCLLVGGPGRGKTAIAILMGVLSGYSLTDIKRGIQHGQPQMTVADLLGNPLPSSLMSATRMDEVQISWRRWLSMRVKIIDEYNRIPTRTQSALLTVMGDNYAEVYDQIYECPEAAWYLTANDDAGGGTYEVIEALRDRIDVVVRALHFNSRFLGELLARVEEGYRPEEVVPAPLLFSEAELDQIEKSIRRVRVPNPIRRRIEFFASQFELFEPAARQLDYLTKDTVRVAGADLAALASTETGKDPMVDLGRQTRNGLSVRALMTMLIFTKAMAWFRGETEVGFEDVRQILPFVLQDKLVPNLDAPFFEAEGNAALRTDLVSWIRSLWDLSCREYDRLNLDKDDPVAAMLAEMQRGLDGVDAAEVRRRLVQIEGVLRSWSAGRKLHGPLYDDILTLKYLHQRYTNYLSWLSWRR